MSDTKLRAENEELRRRLGEAEETLRAIRDGAVDAFVVTPKEGGNHIYTLEGADVAAALEALSVIAGGARERARLARRSSAWRSRCGGSAAIWTVAP